jgi:hypothetical protein
MIGHMLNICKALVPSPAPHENKRKVDFSFIKKQ